MAPEASLRLADSPEAHQRGALACLELLGRDAVPRVRLALRELFDRPLRPDGSSGLKYDFYLAVGPDGQRWGATLNDRHEGDDFPAEVRRFAAQLAPGYALDAIDELTRALRAEGIVRTLAVGFDHPERPPRLKLYFQEEPWGAGVCRASRLPELCAAVGLAPVLPEWLAPDTELGVVTLELYPDGQRGLKLYLGADTLDALERLGPASARPLARALAMASPLGPAHYYLTLRLGGHAPRCAVNKIYEAMRSVDDARERRRAWHDVAGLFELAHAAGSLESVLRTLRGLEGVRVVPTATALEGRLDSVDVYFAAWQRQSQSRSNIIR